MPAAINPSKKPTILIVDCDAESRERLCNAFAEAGYQPLGADTTASAMQLLREDLCDLAIVSFGPENSGGSALCKFLRTQPAGKIPIIALISDDDAGQRAEALSAGADESQSRSSSMA